MKTFKSHLGTKYFVDDKIGNVYILKRNGAYCLSKHMTMISHDDMLCLNDKPWFGTLKEIKEIINNNYSIGY